MQAARFWKALGLVAVVYVAAVAETSLTPILRIGQTSPDLFGLGAMLWLLASSSPYAFLPAGCVGLVADLLGPGRLGIGMAVWLLLGYATVRFRQRVGLEPLPLQWIVLTSVVTIAGLLQAVLRFALGELPGPLAPLLLRVAMAEAYTAALSLPALMVLSWMPWQASGRTARLAKS